MSVCKYVSFKETQTFFEQYIFNLGDNISNNKYSRPKLKCLYIISILHFVLKGQDMTTSFMTSYQD